MKKKGIVLLSGGLDSATVLYYAHQQGFRTACLIFDYGQRHRKEIQRARKLAELTHSPFHIVRFQMPWRGSSLLDTSRPLPKYKKSGPDQIPSTYVPARNILFLSYAASFAETFGARAIFIGANAVDYSGYPDCRPEFLESFETALNKGTKSGVKGKKFKVYSPLVKKSKAQIIRLGLRLGVPYEKTWSCYQGERRPCGVCDSCVLRAKGFRETGLEDPLFQPSHKPRIRVIR